MENTIVVALITALASIISASLGYGKRTKEQAIKDAEREQAQQDFQDQMKRYMARVDKKLDEHNGYAEKFSNITSSIIAIQKDIEYIKKEN